MTKNFRNWSEKLTYSWCKALCSYDEENDIKEAARLHPYTWMFCLIPISGWLALDAIVKDVRYEREEKERKQ